MIMKGKLGSVLTEKCPAAERQSAIVAELLPETEGKEQLEVGSERALPAQRI